MIQAKGTSLFCQKKNREWISFVLQKFPLVYGNFDELWQLLVILDIFLPQKFPHCALIWFIHCILPIFKFQKLIISEWKYYETFFCCMLPTITLAEIIKPVKYIICKNHPLVHLTHNYCPCFKCILLGGWVGSSDY